MSAEATGEDPGWVTRSTDTEPVAPTDRGVYGISVVAELSGVGVQALRLYERHGLLTPARTHGGTRRYSAADLNRIARIAALVTQGVNLAGIGRILDLQDHNTALQSDNSRLENDNRQLREERR